jgi:flagellar FliL protein
MADEEKKEKKPGKGLLIGLIVLIVLLLGILGGGAYYAYSSGMLNNLNNNTESNSKNIEIKKEKNKDSSKLYEASLKDIVLNITKNNGRNALMKLAFTMKSTEESIADRVEENNAEIMDAVISIISTKTAEELRTLGGKEVLKEELLISINDILNENITEDNEDSAIKDGVKKLFFVNFVIK